jgi:hypothetical protein
MMPVMARLLLIWRKIDPARTFHVSDPHGAELRREMLNAAQPDLMRIRLAQIVVRLPDVFELDIDPLLADWLRNLAWLCSQGEHRPKSARSNSICLSPPKSPRHGRLTAAEARAQFRVFPVHGNAVSLCPVVFSSRAPAPTWLEDPLVRRPIRSHRDVCACS